MPEKMPGIECMPPTQFMPISLMQRLAQSDSHFVGFDGSTMITPGKASSQYAWHSFVAQIPDFRER
jgi:hypothetical protein